MFEFRIMLCFIYVTYYVFVHLVQISADSTLCDERSPAMYGHFCSAWKVSVHCRYYCMQLCRSLTLFLLPWQLSQVVKTQETLLSNYRATNGILQENLSVSVTCLSGCCPHTVALSRIYHLLVTTICCD